MFSWINLNKGQCLLPQSGTPPNDGSGTGFIGAPDSRFVDRLFRVVLQPIERIVVYYNLSCPMPQAVKLEVRSYFTLTRGLEGCPMAVVASPLPPLHFLLNRLSMRSWLFTLATDPCSTKESHLLPAFRCVGSLGPRATLPQSRLASQSRSDSLFQMPASLMSFMLEVRHSRFEMAPRLQVLGSNSAPSPSPHHRLLH